MTDALTIALAKGRILDETLPLLARAGIEPVDDLQTSRKLVFAPNHSSVQLLSSCHVDGKHRRGDDFVARHNVEDSAGAQKRADRVGKYNRRAVL